MNSEVKNMRLGRDFTNLLNTSFLTEKEKQLLKEGKLLVADMDAKVQIKSKADILNQIKVAKEVGLDHVELDGGIPNPFLQLTEEQIDVAREFALKNNITLSLHIPYTFVATSTASFQEQDRQIATELIKKYIDFAEKLNCNNIVMHPGSVPFYQTVGEYRNMVTKSVIKSLLEIAGYTQKKNLYLHLENNTAFDCVMFEVEDCIKVLNIVNNEGYNVKFCFDIGHWFTRADVVGVDGLGLEIPNPPEDIIDKIPQAVLEGAEVHLNDYIPKVKKFHPPLHYESGLLKRENLKRLIEKFKNKKIALIVLETAVREIEELLNAKQIIVEEQKYLKSIL